MDLDDPQGLREELYQRLLLAGLRASQKSGAEWRSVEELDLTAGQRFHPGQDSTR